MFQIQINQIIIIDCLFDNELQTARTLHEDIDDLIGISNKYIVELKKCIKKEELISGLKEISRRCENDKIKPLIHIEGHGDNSLFILPDRSTISWKEIYENLRLINEKTRNNLVVNFATCRSESVYDNVDISKPCPAFAILAAIKDIEARYIQDGFLAFYKEFIANNNYTYALEKFTNVVGVGMYTYIVAPELFKVGFSNIVKMHNNDLYPLYFENLVYRASLEYNIESKILREHIKEGMKKPIYHLMEHKKNTFLMLDKFSEQKDERDLDLKQIEYSIRGW